jgi:hypothetical protein
MGGSPVVEFEHWVLCMLDHVLRVTPGRKVNMKQRIGAGFIMAALLVASATAQDWYHDREARYQGNQWRSQLFMQIRTDLDHVWSARGASEKENARLDRTKEELTKMQADLDQGRFDNGMLNDVVDSLKKSANDQRLAPRDRDVLADDVARLHDYQQNYKHWK